MTRGDRTVELTRTEFALLELLMRNVGVVVKQVADSHGGTVTAAAAPGGGALFALRFPTADGGASTTELEVRSGFSSSS